MKFLAIISTLLSVALCCGCAKEPVLIETPAPVTVDAGMTVEDLSPADIMSLSQGGAKIVMGPDTNLPRQIDGKFTTRLILTPEDALASLLSVRGLMGIQSFDFACADIDEAREDIRVFTLEQLHGGLPVYGGSFKIVAAKDGEPVSVRGVYQRDISIGADVSKAISERKARESLELKNGVRAETAQLVVYAQGIEEARISWKYRVTSNRLSDEKTVIIDAVTGDILAEFPTAME